MGWPFGDSVTSFSKEPEQGVSASLCKLSSYI